MDFLDLTSYSPSSENLPYPDTYENAYLADSYVPDYSFNNYENDTFFDTSISPATPNFWSSGLSPIHTDSALSAGTSLSTSTSPSTTMTGSNSWPNLQPTPFGEMGNLDKAFASPEPVKTSTSPCLSPKSLTRRSPSSSPSDRQSEAEAEAEADTKPPPRKRGRPRLYRQSTGSSESASEKAAYPQRLPHNQVERKYREGLNMELERLRRAVPTLPQSTSGAAMGSAKPSKAMVLAAAIDYIKKIEQERDEALFQIERLGGKMRVGMVGKA